MKVRPGFVVSSASHAALLAWGLLGLSAAKPFDVGPTEALPIEIISPEQFDAMTKGSKTSKKVDAPKVKAEKIAEADPEPADETIPVAKEEVNAPPPAPAPAVETPPPPEPKPDPAVAKAAADAEAKAEAAKAAEAKAAQEKAVADKAAKAAAEKAVADKVAQEKAEKLAQAADAERLAKAQAEQEKKAQAEQEKKAQAEKAAADKAAKAEADKAAKEKADKLAKAEAEKAAKAEADRLAKLEKAKADAAKAAEAKKTKFDASKIASLLGEKSSSSDSALKDVRDASRKATAARETAPETTAGTAKGTASKLSVSQRTGIDNAVREQVMQCWNPPVGATNDGSLAVRVQFTLNADGTLSGGPTVTNSSSNPAFRAAAGAATRAVQRCAPLKLPAEAYDYWKQVNINFDPKDMMGG